MPVVESDIAVLRQGLLQLQRQQELFSEKFVQVTAAFARIAGAPAAAHFTAVHRRLRRLGLGGTDLSRGEVQPSAREMR